MTGTTHERLEGCQVGDFTADARLTERRQRFAYIPEPSYEPVTDEAPSPIGPQFAYREFERQGDRRLWKRVA